MAASLLVWMENDDNKVLSERQQQQQEEDHQTKAHHHHHHPSNAKQTRGRNKSGRNFAQKRLPQRGLGVAQLERLRLQERWKKITELDQSQSQSQAQAQSHHHHQVIHHHHTGSSNQQHYLQHHQFQFQFQCPFPFSDRHNGAPSSSVTAYPKCISASSNYGSAVSDGHHHHQSSVVFQYPCPGSSSSSGGTAGGIHMASGELHEVDHRRIAAGELSSSQKIQHGMSDQYQTKGVVDGENLGFLNGRRSAQFHHHVDNTIPAVDNFDLLSLNLGRQSSIVDGSRGNNNRQRACYSSTNVKEEVEVVAVHRRGNPMGTSVLMEYEFFPCRSSSSNSSYYNRNSSIAETHTAAPVVMTEASPSYTNTSSTNWVDLSLRLSC